MKHIKLALAFIVSILSGINVGVYFGLITAGTSFQFYTDWLALINIFIFCRYMIEMEGSENA